MPETSTPDGSWRRLKASGSTASPGRYTMPVWVGILESAIENAPHWRLRIAISLLSKTKSEFVGGGREYVGDR